jgi:hypothetical protein
MAATLRAHARRQREDLGAPIAYQLFKMTKLLDEFGMVP